ncbi:hypothetical protein CVT26_009614 [Gymnopilus dilepis]|uniref:Uncharacterized protein n=1 Tax=Gymnopilus dilepis TaxID=231916 RepID=A0A409VKP0_9AGAR|nr:hypothetical protein CVT26_009614 [Gymnopilus dilepis]
MAMPNVFVVPPEEDDSPPWCFFSADDSDVVEVVHVRRTVHPEPEQTPPRTLRSRASNVLRSLKGSLRSSRNRLSLEDMDDQTGEETVERPRTPSISRRRSSVLSQLFVEPQQLHSRSSTSTLHPAVDTDSLPPSTLPLASAFPCSSSHRSSLYSAMDPDDARRSASSPTPTTSSVRTSRRRFSMLSLQKLFSFSATTTPPTPYDESGEETTTSDSSPSAASSLSSISTPQTPTSTEELNPDRAIHTDLQIFDSLDSVFEAHGDTGLGLGFILEIEPGTSTSTQASASRKRSFSAPWNFKRPGKPPSASLTQNPVIDTDLVDASLEMRLDSLHFDSLSFDADRF